MSFLEIAMPYIFEIIAAIVVALIGVLGSIVISKTSKQKELTNISVALNQLVQQTQDTVMELKKVYTNTWKEQSENGKLTDEQIEFLHEELHKITMQKLAEPAKVLLESAKVDISAMINSVAEAMLENISNHE